MKNFLRYTSEKVVVLHEKGMAIAYHLIIFFLLCFLFIYIGIIKEAHKNNFSTTATFIPSILGKAYGYNPTTNKFNPFDQGDLFDPFMRADSFFIPTALYSTAATQDVCGRPCSSEDDCPNVATFADPVCTNGRCQEQSLCPVSADRFDYYQIAGVDQLTLKMMTVADFPGYSDFVYRRASPNNMVMYPKKNPTGITISDLLSLAKLNVTQVADAGVTLRMNIVLECDLDSDHCDQKLKVQEIDVGTNVLLPVSNKKVNFYEEQIIPNKDNADQPTLRMLVGIRVLVNTQLTASKFSFNKLCILLGVAFACVAFASILMDWVMSHFLAEPRRKNFFRRKYLNSEDFSDLKDRLEEVRKLRKQQFEEFDEDEDHD